MPHSQNWSVPKSKTVLIKGGRETLLPQKIKGVTICCYIFITKDRREKWQIKGCFQ